MGGAAGTEGAAGVEQGASSSLLPTLLLELSLAIEHDPGSPGES